MRKRITKVFAWAAERPKVLLGVVVGLVAGGLMATSAMAIIPDSNGLIHACYRTSGPTNGPNKLGAVRIIDDATETCEADESPISWQQVSPGGGGGGGGGPAGLGQLVTSDFANAELEGFDMRYRDFHGINFSGANLSQAKLGHADVTGANFTGANFNNARFVGQDLSGANITNANMSNAAMVDGTIGATSLSGVSLVHANITNTAGFAGRDYRTGIDLHGLLTTGVDFTGSNFAGYEFSSPTAGRTVFFNANLTNTDFSGITSALADVGMTFNGSNLSGATFANAVIPSKFNQFTFQDVTGTNVNFAGADMRGAHFHRANLTDANFTGVNLSKGPVSFSQPARFFSAVLTNANFTNANLQDAIGFTTATLVNPTWSNTICPDGTNSDNNGGTCIGHFPPEPFIE